MQLSVYLILFDCNAKSDTETSNWPNGYCSNTIQHCGVCGLSDPSKYNCKWSKTVFVLHSSALRSHRAPLDKIRCACGVSILKLEIYALAQYFRVACLLAQLYQDLIMICNWSSLVKTNKIFANSSYRIVFKVVEDKTIWLYLLEHLLWFEGMILCLIWGIYEEIQVSMCLLKTVVENNVFNR